MEEYVKLVEQLCEEHDFTLKYKLLYAPMPEDFETLRKLQEETKKIKTVLKGKTPG
jgi:hypothetical protein